MRGLAGAPVALLVAVLVALALAAPLRLAGQESVVAGLSQNRVAITANFVGSEILIFGAVKREAPIPAAPLGVLITVEGPAAPLVVQRKARRFGIWANAAKVEIDRAPSFYAVATSQPLQSILSATEDLRHRISIPQAIRLVGASEQVADPEAFTAALIRLRSEAGMYLLRENSVDLAEETLFRTRIVLPANLTEGSYATRIFLTRGGRVIDHLDTAIVVRKEGLERLLYLLAHRDPLAYGGLSLVIAILAGWAASTIFRYIRA